MLLANVKNTYRGGRGWGRRHSNEEDQNSMEGRSVGDGSPFLMAQRSDPIQVRHGDERQVNGAIPEQELARENQEIPYGWATSQGHTNAVTSSLVPGTTNQRLVVQDPNYPQTRHPNWEPQTYVHPNGAMINETNTNIHKPYLELTAITPNKVGAIKILLVEMVMNQHCTRSGPFDTRYLPKLPDMMDDNRDLSRLQQEIVTLVKSQLHFATEKYANVTKKLLLLYQGPLIVEKVINEPNRR
ncbi:hypothetical protein PR048_015570, partial [Dryococelus australis]